MDETEEYLRELCNRNGRVCNYTDDDLIVTYDKYSGTDAQYFETYEEAIKWEEGYIDNPKSKKKCR